MRKMNLVFKMMIPALIGIIMSTALTGCSKDDDDNNLAPVGTIAPPEWLIGTWESGEMFDNCKVVADNLTVGLMSFKEMTDLANAVAEGFGSGSVKMKEIKKTDTEYQVGMETKMSGSPTTTDPAYQFKKGDGTYIEVSDYDSETEKWSEFKRYNKKAE